MVAKPYQKLYGRIVAQGETCTSVAKKMNISAQAMSQKMHLKSYFTAKEMEMMGKILGFSPSEYYTLLIEPLIKERIKQ